MQTGGGNLDDLLAEFDARLPISRSVADGGEFINAAERGLVAARDQLGADAPDADLRTLMLEAFD